MLYIEKKRNEMSKYIFGENYDVESVTREIEEYDFIFITDRFDESLVAFKILYGLDFYDIAYVASKHNREPNSLHSMSWPQNVSDSILEKNSLDLKLFEHTNTCLNVKINDIGQSVFLSELKVFGEIQAAVKKSCGRLPVNHVKSRWGDNGIQYQCVEQTARRWCIDQWRNDGFFEWGRDCGKIVLPETVDLLELICCIERGAQR